MKKIVRRKLKSRCDLWHKPCTFYIQASFAVLDNLIPNQANTGLIENKDKILIMKLSKLVKIYMTKIVSLINIRFFLHEVKK